MNVNMGVDEKWKKSAIMDDAVVAELLLQLNAPPPNKPAALSAEWKVRQRRSKTLTGKTPLLRASPTTPLSWNGGGTSVSGGGSEESSQPQLPINNSQSSRSKVTSEAATTGKRPRKKKTLAELKAADLALEVERKQLIEEVKRVRANLDIQRSSNEKLKRFKLELESQTANTEGRPCSSNQVANKPTSTPSQKLSSSDPPASTVPRMTAVYTPPKHHLLFAIPDLNLPLEDYCNIEVQ